MIHDIDILEYYGPVKLDYTDVDDFVPPLMAILNSSNTVCCWIDYNRCYGYDKNLHMLFNKLSGVMYQEVLILLEEKLKRGS